MAGPPGFCDGFAPAQPYHWVSPPPELRVVSPIVITLRYGSQQSGPPSQVFTSESSSQGWRALVPVNTGVPYTVAASTEALGYFVVGFPPARAPAPSPASGAGGPPLALVVAVAAAALIVVVGIPLVVARGRAGAGESEEPDVEPRVPARGQNLGGARRRGRSRGRR